MNVYGVDLLAVLALVVVLTIYLLIFFLRKKIDFTILVLFTMVAGIGVGIIFAGHTSWIRPIGKIYTSVLSALVIPVIVVSIISSLTSLNTIAQLKGIGLKSIGWLLSTTFFSIILALGLGFVFGIGRNSYLSLEGVDASGLDGKVRTFSDVLIGFFPRNIISDISEERTIPVILFTILISVCYILTANENLEKVKPFKDFVDAFKEIIYKALNFVVGLTPYAVLSLIATSIDRGLSKEGMIWSLVVLLIVSFIAFIIDTFFINSVLLTTFANVSPVKFFKKILPVQMVAFSTQSSSSTLPLAIKVLKEKVGVSGKIADVTTPIGTTIGMPGCAGIWPVLIALYGINGLQLNYSVVDYFILVFVTLFVSLGTAGVPGTATITTASVLTVLGLPMELIVLTLPISSIADTGRTATNITGAVVSATIVAKQENELDVDIFNKEDDKTAIQVEGNLA